MAKKFKFKDIPNTYVEAADGIVAKYEYRDHFIMVKLEDTDDEGYDHFSGSIRNEDFELIDDFYVDAYGIEDVRDEAADFIDDLLEKPQRAREELKECNTSHLKDIFYTYATSAPCWADEVMGLVAETKLRKWLIAQIIDMLSDEELIEEMGI